MGHLLLYSISIIEDSVFVGDLKYNMLHQDFYTYILLKSFVCITFAQKLRGDLNLHIETLSQTAQQHLADKSIIRTFISHGTNTISRHMLNHIFVRIMLYMGGDKDPHLLLGPQF